MRPAQRRARHWRWDQQDKLYGSRDVKQMQHRKQSREQIDALTALLALIAGLVIGYYL